MEIKNAKYEISSAKVGQCPATDVPEYAFIGRSNVGKSSLINMIANNSSLAKTSQKPGKTLLINHFKINNGDWYIVDLPGYGYAARGKDQRQAFARMIEGYALERQQLACLFVLVDVRHKPQNIDLEFVDFCGENGVPIAIVFTKADKVSQKVADHNMSLFRKELLEKWEELPPVFLTSSEKKKGRETILDFIEQTNAVWRSSVEVHPENEGQESPEHEDSEKSNNFDQIS
ncbi:MAG: ribosome biogenesis GTP-binding protein YihA/YsxC [Muribaculaceae bacterium]|nr:ribosome biogenesis GTP-binding protein YihA/YsxC [Muribaculaceae bacterium]MDE7096033.1 ribosome biogenesis GTP-binding protein YihA/YsxC [Muribaculaceae bacterium]